MIYPECAHSHLLFKEGRVTQVVPQGIMVLSLEEAYLQFGTFFQSRLIDHERPKNGAFVYVLPKYQNKTPFQIMLEDETAHLFIALGKESTLAVSVVQKGDAVFDLSCESNSRFTMDLIGEGRMMFKGGLKGGATLKAIGASKGNSHQTYRITLDGEGAAADLRGAVFLDEKSKHTTNVLIHHRKPYTRSNQQFKGVLKGHSQSQFEGKIYVDPIAQKTEAYQLNNNLLLSDHAIATTKPNLEIFADDVKASHGATIGYVDERGLFYLQTRGIPKAHATHLLIRGFIQEILDEMTLPSARALATSLAGS
ncbi:MAG: SufD family Fe-S cluster assembly protein [Chlamydiia bacterium]|nr:SufD family Fe-S cluster assembly protein [Chlamydiia bacterium]